MEIINPDIPRVDAVDGPATGIPFLILKSGELAPVEKAEGDIVDDVEATDEDGPNIDGAAVDEADAASAAPGDPAWEAVDASKARTALEALVQVRDQVNELAHREDAEEVYGEAAFNLMDAAEMIDCAVGILAKFAVDEQVEAENALAAAESDARALGLIKQLAARHQPAEPEEAAVAETQTPVTKAEEAMVAVYDQNGNLLGAVGSDAITPLSTSVEPESDAATEGDAPAEDAPAAEAEPVVEAAAAPAEAAAPETPAAAPVAAEPAAPAAAEEDVTKSLDELVAESVAKALEAAVATAMEPVLKSNAELTERLHKMEQTPRDGGPMLSGQRPYVHGQPELRGHADSTESAELRKQLAEETDPGARIVGIADLIKREWQQ